MSLQVYLESPRDSFLQLRSRISIWVPLLGRWPPKGSNVVPFRQEIMIPKKKIGHNQKGPTLEPLGSDVDGPEAFMEIYVLLCIPGPQKYANNIAFWAFVHPSP